MVWSSYSHEAYSDSILSSDSRAAALHVEFMEFITNHKVINKHGLTGVDFIHKKTGKWVTFQNAITKIMWLII